MKLFNLILFAGLLTGYSSYAQNYFPATGNVGIGTNNPYGPLNVDPQGTGGITIGNPSVNSGGFTSLQMGISAVQNGYSFLQGVQASGGTWGNIILNRSGGNIGIGTTTPVSLLDVNGNISVTATAGLFFNSYWSGDWKYRANGFGNTMYQTGTGDFVFSTMGNNAAGAGAIGTPYPRMTILNNGNIGIGTQSPNTKLDVNGVISMNSFGYLSCLRIPANSYTNLFLGGAIKDNADGTYTVYGDGGSNYFSAIKMDNGGDNGAGINFYNGAATGGSNYTVTSANLPNYLQMRIAGGNVSIGTSDSKGYKLAVNGSAIATSMTVKLNSAWPDYVFNRDYQLPSLQEVKAYIDQNQHLPETPSAQQIAKEGLNLGEMNKLQMKKIEELTLYLIEKDTEINEQKVTNNKLQEQINQLNKKLELLINKIK